jgi:hypothetical protein
MSCKNSFLIATNRQYSTHAKVIVDQLESYGALDDGEIVICSPDSIEDARVRYVQDKENLNGNRAFNEGASKSVGEYIYILCDDHFVPSNIVDGDKFLNSSPFAERKHKIATMASGGTCHIGPIPGLEETNFLPLAVMCRFPFLDRKTYVEGLESHIFHPEFNICSHFADNYLSYFLWFVGEPAIEDPSIRLSEMPVTDQFDDGSVEPYGGPDKRYPTGYLDSLEVYTNLCKKLEGNPRHVC